MSTLAIPRSAVSTAPSPSKDSKKRKRKAQAKETNYDADDADLEISAEDLVAADADGEAGGPRAADEEDDEADEGQEGQAPANSAAAVDAKKAADRKRHEQLLLRGFLDEEQGRRVDAFRATVLPKALVKKLNKEIYDQFVPNNLTAVLAGLAKIFVADVIETAKELQPFTEHPTGPLQPYHLKLARMTLQERGVLGAPSGEGGCPATTSTGMRPRKRLFRR